jgi:hypothetical protein
MKNSLDNFGIPAIVSSMDLNSKEPPTNEGQVKDPLNDMGVEQYISLQQAEPERKPYSLREARKAEKSETRRPAFRIGGSRYGEYFFVKVDTEPTNQKILEMFVEKLKEIEKAQQEGEASDNKRQAEISAKQEEKAANDE